MKTKFLLAAKLLLTVLILCTLLFTFYQSALPKEESGEVSDNVSEKLEPIIPSDTPTGEFVHTNIRKIAHVVEFGTLGFFVSLLVILLMLDIPSMSARVHLLIYTYMIAPVTALIDETIQIFSGRGPMISDLWLDVLGFVTVATSVFLIYLAALLILRLLKRRSV